VSEAPLRTVILGSTGSIGAQTLDVIACLRATGRKIDVVGLAAGRNAGLLMEQARSFGPSVVCIGDEDMAATVREGLRSSRILAGVDGLVELAALEDVDLVVNALVGAVGLAPTLAALEQGRRVALANKESLVIGGALVSAALEAHDGRLFPVDSEHNALLQCLDSGRRCDVDRVTLTASGGPFRTMPAEKLSTVTPAQALDHPNWAMGSRITIDSATMVNKAFEVIEAHHLFGLPYESIDVVVHPQSLVHAWVRFADGSTIAQLAAHDMRISIQYAFTYPERIDTGLPQADIAGQDLVFEPLNPERFPAFGIVLRAAALGGSATAAVNAADEVLIARFLDGDIPFTRIADGLAAVLAHWEACRAEPVGSPLSLERLLETDRWARGEANRL